MPQRDEDADDEYDTDDNQQPGQRQHGDAAAPALILPISWLLSRFEPARSADGQRGRSDDSPSTMTTPAQPKP